MVAATAAERARLRRELHDGPGPSLSRVALGLQATADALAGGRPGDAEQLVSRIRAEVDLSLLEVRNILDGLRPVALDMDGLHAALGPALDVDVTVSDLPLLAPEVETAAYRIADEALADAARHARARHLQVAVGSSGAALTLSITDDGTGIAPEARPGIGLTSMRRRAEALGGTLDLDSGAAGTVVTARLPLPAPG